MRRRAFLLAPMVIAAERQEFLDAASPLAAALSSRDAGAFMRHIDEGAPDRSLLHQYVAAVTVQFEVTSSVAVKVIDGDSATLDWYMEFKSVAREAVVERRRPSVKITIRGETVMALTPVEAFKPPIL